MLIDELKGDEAIAEWDTFFLTVPNTFGSLWNIAYVCWRRSYSSSRRG